MEQKRVSNTGRPNLPVSYLGADVQASFPTCGLPEDAELVLGILGSRPTFLMVGTIETRKGHLQAIASFENLWSRGVDANLVIVGHEGWKSLPDEDRRTIPEIVRRIRNSLYLGKRLFCLEGISDEYLEKIYAASSCLITASEDEGFGLPLIEASRHGVPVLARDIAVFREVGGDAVSYFQAEEADGLKEAIVGFLDHKPADGHCERTNTPWLTWCESAAFLAQVLCDKTLVADLTR